MKRNLLTLAAMTLGFAASAQNVTSHVGKDAIFFIGENALVYNGGGTQTQDNGMFDIHGNMMVVGGSTDDFKTLNAAGTGDKLTGSNFVLRLNAPGTLDASTYGQLFITGLPQSKIKGIVSKEFITRKHGATNYFQQIALPFYKKPLSELSTELNKAFSTVRYTQNEILKWNNKDVVSRHFTSLATLLTDPTGYYMLGSKNGNLNLQTPPSSWPTIAPTPVGSVYTLSGVPYGDLLTDHPTLENTIQNAGNAVLFGTGGNGLNEYNEKYNTYVQDQFIKTTTGNWGTGFGKNFYQYGNPYFTNIDLYNIGRTESGTVPTDNNLLTNIWGIKYDAGTVTTLANGSTYSTGAKIVTFDTSGNPLGDIITPADIGTGGFVVKPLQSFVIKMRSNDPSVGAPVFKFSTLRRFKYVSRLAAEGYSVTAGKNSETTGSVKQLGVIGLDVDGKELGRTYYVISPQFTSGHQSNNENSVQAGSSGPSVLGTFEENATVGGYDYNHVDYLLYINEASETDFVGKAIPLVIYNTEVKKLKFEILENGERLEDGTHDLSTGIGFNYKAVNGELTEIKQGDEINVTTDEYGLYYGVGSIVLGTGDTKTSRTIVVYSPNDADYVVQFDPQWSRASVKVYDMSGKLIISESKINTKSNYVIKLSDQSRSTYVVAVESENGQKVNAKIIK